MKIDTTLFSLDLRELPALVRAIEDAGFDCLWVPEVNHDPFLALALSAEHSQRLQLGTAIAVAFPRSPTVLAHTAWDLQRYSQGRFMLGLGTQVKAHNERRFGVAWSKPVDKMRETIEAMHAIWDAWQEGKPLRYRGEFFRLDLMPPFFRAPRLEVERPKILIAAVNQRMLELAGAACDGVHVHPFHTARYLREFAWPHLQAGMARSGRERARFTAVSSVFVVPTDSDKPTAHYEAFIRQQVAFYMSTPAYRVMAELHGWTAIAEQLSKHARHNEWLAMSKLINDEILSELAFFGSWAELPGLIRARYGDTLDRVSYYTPFIPGQNDPGWRATIDGFRATR